MQARLPLSFSIILEKTRKKAGMILSSYFDRRKTKPLIYIKFWKQACLPCLLFGAELFSLNKSQLCQLERCKQWFLKNVFFMCPNLHWATFFSKFRILTQLSQKLT